MSLFWHDDVNRIEAKPLTPPLLRQSPPPVPSKTAHHNGTTRGECSRRSPLQAKWLGQVKFREDHFKIVTCRRQTDRQTNRQQNRLTNTSSFLQVTNKQKGVKEITSFTFAGGAHKCSPSHTRPNHVQVKTNKTEQSTPVKWCDFTFILLEVYKFADELDGGDW